MRKIALLVMVLIIGVMISPAAAQGTIQPFQRLLLLITGANGAGIEGYGDIYSWQPGDASLTRETTYGYNDAPVISPDGTKAVYLSVARSYIEGLARGVDLTGGSGPLPTNIWLMDLTRSLSDPARFVQIANQTTAMPPGTGSDIIVPRSRPVWSPDSALVAWFERDVMAQSFTGRVLTYDTRTGGVSVAAEGLSLGFADGGMWSVPPLTGWGSHIAYTSINAGVYPDMGGAGFGITLDLIGANGGVTTQPVSYFADFENEVTDIRWVQQNGLWRVALAYPGYGTVLLDPVSGTYERLQNTPFAWGIANPGWTARPNASGSGLDWYTPDGTLTVTGSRDPHTFTPWGVPFWLNPNGQIETFGDPVLPVIPQGLRLLALAWISDTWLTDGITTPAQPTIAVG